MSSKDTLKMYDIVLYNHQGTLRVGTITKITESAGYKEKILTLDNQSVILTDNVLKTIANMEDLKKEVYDE